MKQLWQRYAERVDQMSPRERVLVFACGMLMLVGVGYTLLIEPEMKRERRLSSSLAQRQAEAKTLQEQITKVAATRASDPDRAPRERLAIARERLAEIESSIAAEERKFTTPAQMRKVIEELLTRSPSVQLLAMKSLPTTSLAEARAQAAAQGAPAQAPAAGKPAAGADRLVYRHGMEVTVSGPYLELLAYLSQLERLPTQLYWSSLELDATAYPRSTMKLVVYTLSLDKRWLSV
jgi:MSHA biogenesis protein MshJ